MAGGVGGNVFCPVCNSKSGNPAFGRDGSPRYIGGHTPVSPDPVHVKRRARAAAIKYANSIRN